MLSEIERDEIRAEVYADMIEVERMITHNAGSYPYLCLLGGSPVFTHQPVGGVLRYIPPHPPTNDCGLGY